MMGIKSYQERMFYNFSLSKRVPKDHFLRNVDISIDLRFVRELVADKYSHTGQRSIDPEVIFKMMLIGYFYGITSERRLAEDISLNMAYMWFIGYDLDEPTPHHSVFSKARARYSKKVFEQFFQKVLEQCVKKGLVKGEKVFMDSTFIQANASLKSITPRQDAVEPKYSSKEYVDKVFSENPVEDEQTSQVKEQTKLDEDEKPKEQEPKKRFKKYSNKTHTSTTDPESAIVGRDQGTPLKLAYKEHFTVDSHRRIITAVEVTNGAVGDETKAQDLSQQQPVQVKEICADTKYGTYDNYKFFYGQNIVPVIPPFITKHKSKSKFFNKNEFTYNSQKDIYKCPCGKKLQRSNDSAPEDYIAYVSRKIDCKSCFLRKKCFNPKHCKRKVYRHKDEDFRDKAITHLKTERAQETLRKRKYYAEWVNAESKTKHGLRRAMFRGLENVAIQVLLTASVQNIKRLIASIPADTINFSIFKELYINLRCSLYVLKNFSAFA